MNIHKHMEAIFVVTLAAVGLGSYALASLPDTQARTSPPAMSAALQCAMPGVVRGHTA